MANDMDAMVETAKRLFELHSDEEEFPTFIFFEKFNIEFYPETASDIMDCIKENVSDSERYFVVMKGKVVDARRMGDFLQNRLESVKNKDDFKDFIANAVALDADASAFNQMVLFVLLCDKKSGGDVAVIFYGEDGNVERVVRDMDMIRTDLNIWNPLQVKM
jgi:hypothetical protein